MTPADRIIAKFGSLRGLARALGHENPTTVQGWKDRGSIPIKHARKIIAASAAFDVPVVEADFFPADADTEVAA
jgi:hypothetical protein